MPPDINENYDPPVGGRIDAEVLREGGLPPRIGRDELFGRLDDQAPVPAASEPPIYSVVCFRVALGSGVYDYAAIRAGNGKWYPTGQAAQGVDWATLVRAVRPRLRGPIQVMAPDRSIFL